MKNQRYHSIDFMKGICIIFIIITHSSWSDVERLRYLFPFWIDMAVPILMIISGFVYSKSYAKAGIESFRDAYRLNNILGKMIRYTVPFFIVFVLEEIAFGVFGTEKRDICQIIQSFWTGGTGPGSYYYPIMMQFIFYFPIIFWLVKKYDFKGVIICAVINASYECIKSICMMSEPIYRLLLFRYTLLIAVGCYLALSRGCKKNVIVSGGLMLIGTIYIIFSRYLGFTPLITYFWTGTSMMACLFVIPLSSQILLNSKLKNSVLELIGRSSYHIFLVQKIYYSGVRMLYEYIPNRTYQLLLNITIYLSVGIFFCFVESPISKWVNKKVYCILKRN